MQGGTLRRLGWREIEEYAQLEPLITEMEAKRKRLDNELQEQATMGRRDEVDRLVKELAELDAELDRKADRYYELAARDEYAGKVPV